jgi:DNA adenine methylase
MTHQAIKLGGLGGSVLRLIGAKHRIARQIVPLLVEAAAGRDCLVEVFGGSASVMLTAGDAFGKRVYNDLDGDLVNFFRVLADPVRRDELLGRLEQLPPSRQIFDEDHREYLAGGLSFRRLTDAVERARATFYRNAYCYGGKMRNGGFVVSLNDRGGVKEEKRYRRIVSRLEAFSAYFRHTVLEHLHYGDLLQVYGGRANVVLYVDPPYVGSEHYYSVPFRPEEHVFLAQQLAALPAPAVVSYYDHPLLHQLYPRERWTWHTIETVKNAQAGAQGKQIVRELVLVKRASPPKGD